MSKKSKSSKLYSQSADLIGGNEYLIGKILPCLPVRSLIRFKVVSKHWHSLITDPRFGLNHTLQNSVSRIPSGLFFRNSLAGAKTFDSVFFSKCRAKIPSLPNLDALPADISMEIVQSCNGLVLIKYKSGVHLSYCVRNFVTKQQTFVPLTNLVDANPHDVTCFLAFDPLVSPHYKIVGVTPAYNKYTFFIFSSETAQWKRTNVSIEGLKVKNAKGVYYKGSIYWIRIYYQFYTSSMCYRFDVEAENLTENSTPRRPRKADTSYFRYFGEYNGHLNLVYVSNVSTKRFNVLELDDITNKWFIKHRVHINHLISPFPEVVVEGKNKMYAFSILGVTNGEKEEDSALIMTIPGKTVSYNFSTKKVDVLSEFPQEKIEMEFHYASGFPFIATLYPL